MGRRATRSEIGLPIGSTSGGWHSRVVAQGFSGPISVCSWGNTVKCSSSSCGVRCWRVRSSSFTRAKVDATNGGLWRPGDHPQPCGEEAANSVPQAMPLSKCRRPPCRGFWHTGRTTSCGWGMHGSRQINGSTCNGMRCCRRWLYENLRRGRVGQRPSAPPVDATLEYVRLGDTLVVWRLDRLGPVVTSPDSRGQYVASVGLASKAWWRRLIRRPRQVSFSCM